MKNVFISSTFTDLEDHRNFVREGVRQLGLVDLSMENFGARDERPKDECIRMISEESDYFVGIYAHKYGYIPDGGGKSMTEAEYEAATISNLPRFIYVVDEGHPWPPKQIDDGAEKKKIELFKVKAIEKAYV